MDSNRRDSGVRIDKWLWAARFYRTRPFAQQALSNGKVQVQGSPAKASRIVRVGDEITLEKEGYYYCLTVVGLSEKRGPASEAVKLYCESEESIQQRIVTQVERKIANLGRTIPGPKPDKRQRRKIMEWKDEQSSADY
jgi:ribosome-associated heat shock protein Hsp15